MWVSSIICAELTIFPLMADNKALLEIDCFINQRLGLIICRQDQIAVLPEHLQSHLITKHDLYHSAEALESDLESYSVMSLKDATEFVKCTDMLPEPIDGLPIVEEGYKCVVSLDDHRHRKGFVAPRCKAGAR